MTIIWGPGMDAELSYRRERVAEGFRSTGARRRSRWDRRSEGLTEPANRNVPTRPTAAATPAVPAPRRGDEQSEVSARRVA